MQHIAYILVYYIFPYLAFIYTYFIYTYAVWLSVKCIVYIYTAHISIFSFPWSRQLARAEHRKSDGFSRRFLPCFEQGSGSVLDMHILYIINTSYD